MVGDNFASLYVCMYGCMHTKYTIPIKFPHLLVLLVRWHHAPRPTGRPSPSPSSSSPHHHHPRRGAAAAVFVCVLVVGERDNKRQGGSSAIQSVINYKTHPRIFFQRDQKTETDSSHSINPPTHSLTHPPLWRRRALLLQLLPLPLLRLPLLQVGEGEDLPMLLLLLPLLRRLGRLLLLLCYCCYRMDWVWKMEERLFVC